MDYSELTSPVMIFLLVITGIIFMIGGFIIFKIFRAAFTTPKIDPTLKNLAIQTSSSICQAFNNQNPDLIKNCDPQTAAALKTKILEYRQLAEQDDTLLKIKLADSPYVTIHKQSSTETIINIESFYAHFEQKPNSSKPLAKGLNPEPQGGTFKLKLDKNSNLIIGISEDLWGEKYGQI